MINEMVSSGFQKPIRLIHGDSESVEKGSRVSTGRGFQCRRFSP